MIALALMLAAPDPAHAALDRLSGCWIAEGEVMGKAVKGVARGTWRLGRRYLLFEMHAPDPEETYDAAILVGDMGGDTLNAWWMDSFGAAYSAQGKGQVSAGTIALDYDYGDSLYLNRYAPDGEGWRWTIVERKDGKDKDFASYTLSAATCDDTAFAF